MALDRVIFMNGSGTASVARCSALVSMRPFQNDRKAAVGLHSFSHPFMIRRSVSVPPTWGR